MRWLVRLKNILAAHFHTWLDRFEEPRSMATQALRELEKQGELLRQNAAMAVAVERRLWRELDRQQTQVKQWKEKAKIALGQEREDLARWALTQGLRHQDLVSDLQAEHFAADQACAEFKQALQTLEARLTEAGQRHLMLTARSRLVAVREQERQITEVNLGVVSARLDRWQERLTESAEVLLALVEVCQPRTQQDAELIELETTQRIDSKLKELQQEMEPRTLSL